MPTSRQHGAVRLVVAVVLLEAAALVLAAGWGALQLITGSVQSLGVLVFLVIFTLAVAAVLVAAVRALLAGRRGGRGPVITWQLLQGATALTVLQATVPSGVRVGAWVALVVAAVVLVLMLTRPVVELTGPPRGLA